LENEQEELKDIHNILEDAYVDNRLGRVSPTLSEYIKQARTATYPKWGGKAVKALAQKFNRDSVRQVWTAISLYGENIPDDASEDVAKSLSELLGRTLSYIKEDDSSKRLEMVVDTWEWFQQIPTGDNSDVIRQAQESNKASGDSEENGSNGVNEEGSDAADDIREESEGEGSIADADGDTEEEEGEGIAESDADEGDESDAGGDTGDDGEEDEIADIIQKNLWGGDEPGSLGDLGKYLDKPKTDLGHYEAKELEDYINTQQEDLTRQLDNMGIRAGITKIKNASYSISEHQKVKGMVQRETQQIHHIFSQLDVVESRWRHGLQNGKLDGRRLSKVGAGKTTVFKLHDIKDRPSLAVVLLLDVSGSMNGQLDVVDKTACIFSEGLKPLCPKIWYEVLTYDRGVTTGGIRLDRVQLTRVASSTMKLSLNSIWHGGTTPSGEAIGASLVLLNKRMERRKVIIHFTDGYPDDSYTVQQALESCQKGKVEVITISVGTKDVGLYGEGKVEVIREVAELPNAVTKMVRKIYRR
jgi:nitric oxide reductase activation protein